MLSFLKWIRQSWFLLQWKIDVRHPVVSLVFCNCQCLCQCSVVISALVKEKEVWLVRSVFCIFTERLSMAITWERSELFTSGNSRVELLESFGACSRVPSWSALLYKIAHPQWKWVCFNNWPALGESMHVSFV